MDMYVDCLNWPLFRESHGCLLYFNPFGPNFVSVIKCFNLEVVYNIFLNSFSPNRFQKL